MNETKPNNAPPKKSLKYLTMTFSSNMMIKKKFTFQSIMKKGGGGGLVEKNKWLHRR
jgi:hypothetical protein